MQNNRVLLSLLVFACVFVPYLVADSLVRLPRISADSFPGRSLLPDVLRRLFPFVVWGGDAFGIRLASMRPERAETIRRQLLLANLPLTPEMVMGGQATLALAGVLFGLILFALSGNASAGAWLGGLVGFCGWFFPPSALQSRAENRRKEIIRGLPFAIDLIGSAMHAGLDFNAAVRYYVGLGLKNPVSEEFGLMLRESELGKSRVEALQSMADRVQTPVFTSFVDAVAHGIEVGASLVGTMKMQGEDMRRARFHLAEEKAARAPSLMILPLAVFIMPAVFVMVFVPVIMRYKAARGG
jgi:tight adherence protein C